MIDPGAAGPAGATGAGGHPGPPVHPWILRPARASDAAAAAPLLYDSGPRVVEYLFGSREAALRFFLAAFPQRAHEMSYACHTVAVANGMAAGIGGAYGGTQTPRFLLGGAAALLRCFGLRRGLPLIRRALAVERVVRPPRGDLHYIAHISVAPALRGHGLGTALVEHLLNDGRQRRRRRAALDVAADNHGAFILYRRLGFEVVAEIPSPLPGVPSHYRLERPL